MWLLFLKSLVLFAIGYLLLAALLRWRRRLWWTQPRSAPRRIDISRGYCRPIERKWINGESVLFYEMMPSDLIWVSFEGNGRDRGSGKTKADAYRNLVENRQRASYITQREDSANLLNP